jgi:hypothetical protein
MHIDEPSKTVKLTYDDYLKFTRMIVAVMMDLM